MRPIGFSKKWPKLHLELPIAQRPEFTTFRLTRKDADRGRDWHQGEQVQVVFHPRSKDREALGVADIVSKEPRVIYCVTNEEAIADGFPGGYNEMIVWLGKAHDCFPENINKLTLRWVPPEF